MNKEHIEAQSELTSGALNRVCKWRTLFAGWQLGTRPDTDAECRAVRDQRDLLIMLRCENNALLSLLIKKGLINEMEWLQMLEVSAKDLDKLYEEKFPGFRTTDMGIQMFDLAKARKTMEGWKP
jgi:hypothetical protein